MRTSLRFLPLLAVGLPLLLAACDQSQATPPGAADPYAGGAAYPWSYTAPAGTLAPLSLTPGENTLQYERLFGGINAWGPAEKNSSNGEQKARDGRPITLNGKVYSQGYGVHAGSELYFRLEGTNGAQCTRFTVDVGVDDEVGARGSVVFQVFLDAEKAYDSGVMTGASATKTVDLTISGKEDLWLFVKDAGDGISYDHADWANPRIFCQAPTTAGSLDPSFDGDGRVELTGSAQFADVLPQPDGKLLAITADLANPGQIRRYLPDGGLDTTFGQQGSVALPENLVPREGAFAPDGKLLISGLLRSQAPYVIGRYLSDGRLDSSFGAAGFLSLRSDRSDVLFAVQADGRIVVATTEVDRPNDEVNPGPARLILRRYITGGTLDPSFGTAGRTTVIASPGTMDTSLLQQRDGKLVVFYEVTSYGKSSSALTRYSADGQPDVGFGVAGAIPVQFAAGEVGASVHDMAQQADGKLVLAGFTRNDSPDWMYTLAFARYTPGGQLDSGFGSGGIFIVPHELNSDYIGELAVQADGRILATLVYTGALRVTADGHLDTSFGTGGLLRLKPADPYVRGIALQADGKVLLSASELQASFLLRLLP